MRLNMWMIVNRLQVLEPQLHLLADSPAEIRGVRPYQADHYAYVSEKNGDAWCSYGEEYFVLPSLSRDVALGLVQDVFEFYNTWEEQTLAALGRMDFQSVIDSCSPILSNPLVLLDANYKVMAMSSRYGEEEVDREWAYLSRNGFSSIKAVKGLRSQREDNLRARERNPDAILRLRPDWSGYVNVSCSIQFDRIPCGSLVIIEKERLVNKGDVLFAGHLCRLLSSYLNKITFSSSYTYGTSVFYRLMNGQAVDEAVLQMQMVYYDWKTDDPYPIGTGRPRHCCSGCCAVPFCKICPPAWWRSAAPASLSSSTPGFWRWSVFRKSWRIFCSKMRLWPSCPWRWSRSFSCATPMTTCERWTGW